MPPAEVSSIISPVAAAFMAAEISPEAICTVAAERFVIINVKKRLK